MVIGGTEKNRSQGEQLIRAIEVSLNNRKRED